MNQQMKIRVIITCISLLSVVKSQENLSRNGTASQSSTYYWRQIDMNMTADLAITGGRTHDFDSESCATTYPPPDYFSWWMLTFPVHTVYVTNIRIYYRGNRPDRLAGYSLYISNSSTTKTNGYLCYHHEGPNLPSVFQNVNCNRIGQYVIIYNERNETSDPPAYSDNPLLELCEVEIYGCYKGWWGTDCENPCPVNCISGHCYPSNGSCVWGCNSDNCLNDICDTDTGVCTDGCKIELDGDSCDKSCLGGTYGQNCNQICPDKCYKCHSVSGICLSGCSKGWMGPYCREQCTKGRYGINCESQCDTCVNKICDRLDGNCTHGCIDGFRGDGCHITVTSQSATNYTAIFTGVGTFVATALMCVCIALATLRYRRNRDRNIKQQNRHKMREFDNNMFTNDYTDIGANSTETHYEETIPVTQEQPYDTI